MYNYIYIYIIIYTYIYIYIYLYSYNNDVLALISSEFAKKRFLHDFP